jgi:HEAT repeat protein
VRILSTAAVDEQRYAARALACFGDSSAALLGKYLTHDDARVRAAARTGLRELGTRGRAELAGALVEGGDAVRKELADELGALRAIPELRDLLAHENADVRRMAAYGLGSAKRYAIPAVAALTERLDDEDTHVRAQAAWALGEIGPAAKPALPVLRALAKRGGGGIVRAAIRKIEAP